MSTKSDIYFEEETNAYLYEEAFWSDGISPAFIEVSGFKNAKVDMNYDESAKVTIAISADVMDKLAVAWCKKRKLLGGFGGPVGKEYSSPNCPYD